MPREDRRFIESPKFPVALVSAASAKEKRGGGLPPFWQMIFWWTRKPLASARAVIAGCLLPENVNIDEFMQALRLNEKIAHSHNPTVPEKWKRYFEGKKLLDPFAGFGSIPLEAARLGLNATAAELLPSCYIFLKAVLEYPLRYGKNLVDDVDRWSEWVANRLMKDEVIQQLYDHQVAAYVGSWKVRCPHCGTWTPLISNFWLARVRGRKAGYERLVWMELTQEERGELSICINDLGENVGSLEGVKIEKNKVKTSAGKIFVLPTPNISPKSEQATCLNPNCNGNIRYIDTTTGKHYVDRDKAPDKQRLEWYVKYALGKYHNGDPSLAKPALFVKVRKINKKLEFKPSTEEDQKKLETAVQEIAKLQQHKDPDLPTETLAPYGTQAIGGYLQPINYEMKEWFKLFNPRQLLTLVKLVKLIREAGEKCEEEKLRLRWTQGEAKKYAESVTTYLAIALCRYSLFNSVVSPIRASTMMGSIIAGSLTFRGIAMVWNWGELAPTANITGSWVRNIKTLKNGLEYLSKALHGNVIGNKLKDFGSNISLTNEISSNIEVELADATTINFSEKFDLIITDPPYYSDVPYAELSDFYFVWLKRALSGVSNNRLEPRFHAEAFFKKISEQWIEIRTQWEEFALREVSLNPPRLGKGIDFKEGVDYFQKLLDASFTMMFHLLNEEGIIATYYAHTSPEAWKALLRSGWESAALSIVSVFPIATESLQSVVKRGKLSLDTSMIVVWKGFASNSVQASRLYEDMVNSSEERARIFIDMGVGGRDLFVGTLAGALSAATRYKEVVEMKKLETGEIVDKYVYPATLYGLVRAITKKAKVEEGVRSNEAMLYLVVKSLAAGAKNKAVTSDDARIFSIGTGVDLSHVARSIKMFKVGGKEEEGEGSSLAKRKTLVLLEPPSEERIKIKNFLDYRELDPENPKVRCSVDALHLLEYYSVSYGKEQFASKLDDLRKKYPTETDEAITLARVISGSLTEDIEAKLCSKILDKIAYYKPSQQPLTQYLEGEK